MRYAYALTIAIIFACLIAFGEGWAARLTNEGDALSTDDVSDPVSRAAPAIPSEASAEKGKDVFVGGKKQKGWVDVLAEPNGDSERIGQLLLGERVTVRASVAEWTQIRRVGGDALVGWTASSGLAKGVARFLDRIDGQKLVVIKAPGVEFEASVFVPFGTVLPQSGNSGAPSGVLPDGRILEFSEADVRTVGSVSVADALAAAKGFRHTSYQRGANSAEAMDAGGLVSLILRVAAIVAPRDPEALIKAGRPVSMAQARTGDVMFFSTFDPAQPHPVMLLDEGRTFLEASPAGGVNVGAVEQMRNRKLLAIRRYD